MRSPKSARCSRRLRPQRKSKPLRELAFLPIRLMRVVGRSMTPTLKPGELIFVSAAAYRRRPPRRGELVAARPAALGGRALVKRLIGLPREPVEVDGRRWQLGDDQFFLLGDRREQSDDSRTFGPVSRHELLGPVRLRLWPWKVFTA